MANKKYINDNEKSAITIAKRLMEVIDCVVLYYSRKNSSLKFGVLKEVVISKDANEFVVYGKIDELEIIGKEKNLEATLYVDEVKHDKIFHSQKQLLSFIDNRCRSRIKLGDRIIDWYNNK